MKKNLLLLLTVLFSLCTTNAWAATETYVKVTTAPTDWSGEYLIVYETGNVAFNGSLTTLDAISNTTSVTISNSEISLDPKYSFTIAKSSENYTIKSASGYYIGQNSDANGLASSTSTTYSNTISIDNDGTVNLVSGGAYLRYNAAKDQTRFRYYKSSTYTGQKAICLYKKLDSYTVNWTIDPAAGGTLSAATGTSTTVTPNSAYTYGSPAYTVTSGSATVSQNGNTFTATPTANSAIQINMVEKQSATITLSEAGATTSVTGKYVGDSYTLPSTTSQPCGDKTFVGWSTTTITNSATKPTTNYYEPGASVTLAANQTFYAVFATTSGGGSTYTPYKFTISASNFNTTSYDANNNEKTSTATATDGSGSTFSVKWTSNQVMKGTGDNSSNMQWQKSKGYIYNSTNLGTINSVTITSSAGTYTTYYGTSEQPSSGTTVGNGYFKTSVGNATGYASKIEITFTKTTGTPTTYSDYTTQCSTETLYSVTYNGNGSTSGSVPVDNTEYEKDDQVTVLGNTGNLAKTGHTFNGWNTKADGTGTPYTAGATFTITEKTTLYAQWTINQYTVTLNPNYPDGKTGTFKDKDGNTISGDLVLTYDYGTASQTITELYQTIKLDGYRFDGWYNAKGASEGTVSGSKWSVTGNITRDLNFYAKWTEVDCRWIETDIANILPEDEVLITMKRADNGNTYTLDHSKGTSELPPAQTITINGNEAVFSSFYHNNSIWNISANVTGGYILYPNGSHTTWLYCTKSNNNVKVGTVTSNVFTIENGYLKHTNTDWVAYVGVYISGENDVWRHHNSPTALSIAGQTLKFYKRVCVDESNPWCTVTFDAGSGSCDTESLIGTMNEGITLPTATPSDACATDGWIFAGWWTDEVGETTTSPGELLTAESNYKPEGNITLHAVYSKEETDEGGSTTPTEATLSFANKAQRTEYSATKQVWEQSGITLTNNKAASTSNVGDYADPARFYASSSIIISAPGAITQIVADCDESEYATALSNSIEDDYTMSEVNITITPSESSNTYTIASLKNQTRFNFLTVTYLAESGPTTTTTYNSNPSCEACENILTINKGEETNGNTFTLSPSGDIKTCDGDVEVFVTPTPAEHYSVSEVTATTPTTGGTPTITNNGDGTWTVTYAQNSKGESTINVTFVEDAKATITLSELGVTSTIDTYYVGAQYTLPTTSSQSCEGKELVGWSTVEVAETDTKPTENYYELGAEVTLAAEQTFYAVFATLTSGGEGTITKLTADDDFYYGDKIILIAENTRYGLYRSSSSNYVNYWTTSNNDGVPTAAEIEADSKRFIEISEGTTEGTIKLGNVTDGYLYNPSSTDLSISTTNASDWELIAWNDNTFTFKAIQYLSCRTDLSGTNANKWRGAGVSCNCETGENCSGTIYYNIYRYASGSSYSAYTTSCVPTYTITYDFAGGTGSHCSNTSVPQGDSYTICDEAPTKEGHTFLGWSDGTDTYAAGETITPTGNVTLTAQWQINTYTVIWSNNGATTEESYEHGQTLNVPAPEDIPSCDGVKEFVGWTADNTFTYHATTPPSDIFTEKIATVTADATYYAVFATPPGTGGGGGGSETTTTLNFNQQGYSNGVAISNLTVSDVTATFNKGSNSNAPKYYDTGSAIRAYGGNTITISYTGTITKVTFTFSTGGDGNEITANNGDGEWNEPDWTGNTTNDIVFTIGGTSGHRRIQSIAVTCTSGGGSGSYSDYTTICQQIESIEVQNPQTEFYLTDNFTIGEGKVIATLSGGGTADVTALATFSGYDMEKVGTYTVTVTYMGATATYNIEVKPLDNAWVLTWNVSGKTNTGLRPRQVTKGSTIGTLPTPEVPAACEGKTFMGWTESNTVPSDGVGIEYIKPTTIPTDNTTYYAVFATVNNFSVQKPIEDIESGSKVVVVAVASLTADGGSGKAISSRATDDTHNLQGDSVAIYDETINTPHSTCIWTITKKDGKYVLTQDGKYLNGVLDGKYSNLKYLNTEDSWTLHPAKSGMTMTYNMESTNASGEYIEWYRGKFAIHNEVNDNGDFDMQFFVTLGDNADITDYTTGCEEYTITYYGFRGGYSTSSSSDGIIVLPVNSKHTVPDCGDVVKDHTNLGREFLNLWMTQPHGGQTFKPGDTFILTQDTTLYAQWKLNTTTDVTLPTGVEDLAGTDVYVYGGNTLTMVPDIVTINSLTLKGGLQPDGSYQMPNVWIPDGATLVRNTNKINLDLVVNAKNYYPFAVPFAAKNNQYVEYIDPTLAAASTYGTHFAIKTYDGARRAEVGEDRANNWVRVLRDETLQPGVGYIISAMTYPDKDTATIRIPMTVPNTWFENGEQTMVGTTTRNAVVLTAHTGAAATEHQRHAGWNFVASPYLSNFSGNNIGGEQGYINGWINISNNYEYEDTEIPYVTIPVADFSYYNQIKVAEATLSPEWSFFVQIGTGGTMNFATEGRKQAPASVAARSTEERPVKMEVDITLTNGSESDQTGLIICDQYSDAYEIGRDLEKMFGSAYNLVVYSLMPDNTPLAYQAVPLLNETHAIPIGYRAPEQGEYTFSLKQNTSSIDLLNEQYEQLVLVDYEKGALTNLLNSDYTFSSERTQSNSRFALYAVPRQDSSTELPNISDEEDAIRKIFYNGHLFIIRNGNVYNGNGQIVK